MPHIVCVDAYEGELEPLSDDPREREDAYGLGLPWVELADILEADITLLGWRDWYAYEAIPGSFAQWTTFPSTRRAGPLPPRSPVAEPAEESVLSSPRIRRAAIPAVDPDHGRPLATSTMSARAHGMLAEGDPLFFLSCVLRRTLEQLHAQRPIDLLVLPAWQGLGYVVQLDRATVAESPLAETGTAVVMTGLSAARLSANQEGDWTRMAIARRQREELSVALADVVLTFGDRGAADARRLRLRDAVSPIPAPRRVGPERIEALRSVARRRGSVADSATSQMRPAFFLADPYDGSSGAMAALDAARLLDPRDVAGGLSCVGPDMRFAPMAPRSFRDYWSTRGWVQELVESGLWRWRETLTGADGGIPVRLYPSAFGHLVNLWPEVARGTIPVVSPAAAEGVAAGRALPQQLLLDDVSPQALARHIGDLSRLGAAALESLRLEFCTAMLESHRGDEWMRRLHATADALRGAARRSPRRHELARVLRRQLDPRRSLVEWDAVPVDEPPPDRSSGAAAAEPQLTVVVTCFEMGALVVETVESVWRSTRLPDELLLVDDGSRGRPTIDSIALLEQTAAARTLPLRIVRQRNRGLAAARNTGLALARGDFISFLDGDDLILPSFYEVAAGVLSREPGLGAVAAWADIFGEGVDDGFWNAPQAELPLLLVENQVFVPAMTRTALLRELGGYDETQRFNYEDWELSVRYLARGHPIVTIPRYLQRYRVRADSLYRGMTDVQHQVMHERLLRTHRPTAERFGVELAMQLEHRLATRLYPRAAAGTDRPNAVADSNDGQRQPGWLVAASRLRLALRRAARVVRGRGD